MLSVIVQIPKRNILAHPCMILCVLNHCASKSANESLQLASPRKKQINKIGVLFHVLGHMFPYKRLAKIFGYVFPLDCDVAVSTM